MMINYKKLYKKQYGEKKLINSSLDKYCGLRKLFQKYDWDRYFVAEQLVEQERKILGIRCRNGYNVSYS